MARKRNANSKRTTSSRQPTWLLVAVALALVLIVGGAAALLITDSVKSTTGTPKLVIEQTVIDEGYQTNNTPVRTAFNIRNEGDGPLRVLGEPRVELVEGCWPPPAVVSSTTIDPGQEAEVTLDYTMSAGMDGPHRFDVTLRTNDPENPEVVLIAKSDWGP